MNLDQMHYIVELEKSKSFSQAAYNLNISQSGLSQSIDNLENELGIKLFKRTRMGSTPTLTGLKIIKHAKEVEKQFYLMKLEVSESVKVVDPPLRMAVMNEVPSTLLDWLLKFQEQEPNFKAYLQEDTVKNVIDGVKQDKYNVGLIAIDHSSLHLLDSLNFRAIGSGQFKMYTTANHYLADYQGPIPLKLVLEQEFALFIDDYIEEFVNKLESQYGDLNIIVQSTSFRVIFETMRKFQAVSIIRDTQLNNRLYSTGENDLLAHEICGLNTADQKFRYGLITRENQRLTPLQEQFVRGVFL